MIDLAKLTGDGGLACTRITREDRMVSQFPTGIQTSFPAFQEESALISHRADALFHPFKSNHRIEFADTLLIRGGGIGEFVERDVFFLKQRLKAILLRQKDTSEITWDNLFLNELPDLEG